MKILVVSQYYYPEQFRVTDICEELVRRGNEVTVVAGVPNYPEGEIYKGYEKGKRSHEVINGVDVIRCSNRPRHTGALNLTLNYISYALKAWEVIKHLDKKYDVVFVYEISPITMAYPAIKYRNKNKVPVYLYCLDIWPECVRDIKQDQIMSKRNPIYLISLAISKCVYNNVDRIGIKCEPFRDYLINVCDVDAEKIVLLYEHAEDKYLNVKEKSEENGCYDFYFMGNIGHSQNCELIVKAAQHINSQKKYLIHFVGDGSEKRNLQSLVQQEKLEGKIVFHRQCALNEVIQYYNNADCCLLTLSDRTESGATLPGKLVGYMGASRPVIAAATGATGDIIQQADCGVCVLPNDCIEFAAAMENALENSELFEEKGRHGRSFFLNNFTIDIFIRNLVKQLSEISYRRS